MVSMVSCWNALEVSCLVEDSACVCINGNLSSWTQVTSGVPQDSVLDPMLFALYVNELPSLVSSSLLLFVDDIKLHRCIFSFIWRLCWILAWYWHFAAVVKRMASTYLLMYQNVRSYILEIPTMLQLEIIL